MVLHSKRSWFPDAILQTKTLSNGAAKKNMAFTKERFCVAMKIVTVTCVITMTVPF
jgi:hypothetical protein